MFKPFAGRKFSTALLVYLRSKYIPNPMLARYLFFALLISLLSASCNEDENPDPCPADDFTLRSCDMASDINYHVLEGLASYFSGSVHFVQKMVPYNGETIIDYLPACHVSIDSQHIASTPIPSDGFLCQDSLESPILSLEEISCVIGEGGQSLFMERFGSSRYLEVSPPVEDENGFAYIIYQDSRCSIESAILQKVDGVWEVICQRQVAVC